MKKKQVNPYKAEVGTRIYQRRTVEDIKSEFQKYELEAHQIFIDFEQLYGGLVLQGIYNKWYLSLALPEHFILDDILFIEFGYPCVAQPWFYYLGQNGKIYGGMGEEEWEITSSLAYFLASEQLQLPTTKNNNQ